MKGKKNSLVALSSKWVKADRRSRADEVFALPAFPEASPQAMPGCQLKQSGKPLPEVSPQPLLGCQIKQSSKPLTEAMPGCQIKQLSKPLTEAMPGCQIKQSGKPLPEAMLGFQIKQSGKPLPEAVPGCQNEQLFNPIIAVESGHELSHEHMKKDPEQLKETMLQHETMFRDQVRELHRLYQVQQLLMSNSQVKTAAQSSAGVPSSNGSAMCSSNSIRCIGYETNKQDPAGELKDGIAQQQCWNFSAKYEQQQVLLGSKPLSGMLQEVPKDTNKELIKPKGHKVVQRIFDLELPAEAYMDIEMPNEAKGFTTIEYASNLDSPMYQHCGTAQHDGELRSQTGMEKKFLGSTCVQNLEHHEESVRQHRASFASFEACKFPSRMDCSLKEVPVFSVEVSTTKPLLEGHKGLNPESQMEKTQLPDSLHRNTWLADPEPSERSANHSSDYAHWLLQDVSASNKMPKNRNVCANGAARSHDGQVIASIPQILPFQRLPPTDYSGQGQLRICTPPPSRFKRDAWISNPSTYPSVDLQPPAIGTHGRAMLSHPVENSCGSLDRLHPWFHPEMSCPLGQQEAITRSPAMGQERMQVLSHTSLISPSSPLNDKPPWPLSLEFPSDPFVAHKVFNSMITNPPATVAAEQINVLPGTELRLGLPTSMEDIRSGENQGGESSDGILPLRDGFEEAHVTQKRQKREAYEAADDYFGPSSEIVTNTFKSTFVQGFSSGWEMRYPHFAQRIQKETIFDTVNGKRAQNMGDDPHVINQLASQGHDHGLQKGSSNLNHNALRENLSMPNCERDQHGHDVYQGREGKVSDEQMPDCIVPQSPSGAGGKGLGCKDDTFENDGLSLVISHSHEENGAAASSSSRDSGKVSGAPFSKPPNKKPFHDRGNAKGTCVNEDEASDISNQAVETLLSLNYVPLHLDNELSANEGTGKRKECLKWLANSSPNDREGASVGSKTMSLKEPISLRKGPSERTCQDFCANEKFPSRSSLSSEEIADSDQVMECALMMGHEGNQKNAVYVGNDDACYSAKCFGKAVAGGKAHEIPKAFSWGESARRRRIRRWRSGSSVFPVCREQIHKPK